MAWEKPSSRLVELFEELVPDLPGIEKRKMFGHPAAFINNNMFMGVKGDRMILRMSDKDREEFLGLEESSIFECTPGKFWNEYVVIPDWMYEDLQQIKPWIDKSFRYGSGLPVKQKKKK